MYYKPYNTPCVPKIWNISDHLRQIEYVFSNKTATLTQKVIEFQKCSINGIAYGEGITEAQRGAATREGQADALDPQALNEQLASLEYSMIIAMERAFKQRIWLTVQAHSGDTSHFSMRWPSAIACSQIGRMRRKSRITWSIRLSHQTSQRWRQLPGT